MTKDWRRPPAMTHYAIMCPRNVLLTTLLGLASTSSLIHGQGEEPPRPKFEQGKADPGAPVPDPAAAMKRMKQTGPDEYELGQIRFNGKTREVRIPAMLNMRDGALEYLLVHENGKTHESLLKTTASALDAQVALLLCSYQPGHTGLFDYEKDEALRKKRESTAPKTPGANKVRLELEWKDGEKTTRLPVTQCVLEAPGKKPPTEFDHWIFNGSMIQASGFSAELLGSFIGLYYDVTAVINCPSKANDLDDIWSPNTPILPKEETPVTVIVSPFPALPSPAPSK